MKSNLTYEMHNYAIMSTPNIPQVKGKRKGKTKSDIPIEKYSLRQRQKRKHTPTAAIQATSDYNSSGGGGSSSSNSNSDNYNEDQEFLSTTYRGNKAALESRVSSKKTTTTPPKTKTKTAPLSKYRRKTANARERTRMREINTAFETLRHCVPLQAVAVDNEEVAGANNEKLTKITTLRLAMKYISMLTEALDNPDCNIEAILQYKAADNNNNEDMIENAEFAAHVEENCSIKSIIKEKLITKPQSNKRKKEEQSVAKKTKLDDATNVKASLSKRQSKYKADKQKNSATNLTSNITNYKEAALTTVATSLSTIAFNNTVHLLDNAVNISELNSLSLLLESDGESLHLSEHCLSPIPNNYTTLLSASNNDLIEKTVNRQSDIHSDIFSEHIVSPTGSSSPYDNPFELQLHLASASTSSLDFTCNQPPSLCTSPLISMDTMHPFGDLLHSDFHEDNPLDLFLT